MGTLVSCSQSTWEEREQVPHNIYAEYSNRERRSADEASHPRHKRALGADNTCPLHMRADAMLFNYFKNTKHGETIVSAEVHWFSACVPFLYTCVCEEMI